MSTFIHHAPSMRKMIRDFIGLLIIGKILINEKIRVLLVGAPTKGIRDQDKNIRENQDIASHT